MADISNIREPPMKRQKLLPVPGNTQCDEREVHQTQSKLDAWAGGSAIEQKKETEVGITTYVRTETHRCTGLLKKRYTDFLVNEILPNGAVLHLRNTSHLEETRDAGEDVPDQSNGPENNITSLHSAKAPQNGEHGHLKSEIANVEGAPQEGHPQKQNGAETRIDQQAPNDEVMHLNGNISGEDKVLLAQYFEQTVVEELLSLYNKVLQAPNANPRDPGTVKAPVPADRSTRTVIHQAIRRVFNSRIESSTSFDGSFIVLSANTCKRQSNPNNQQQRRSKLSWNERGGSYLHFTLYKENKDTMEVLSFLARMMKCNAKIFAFAGTKDRRAVTVQRCSAYRAEADRLAGINRVLRNAAIGDFKYQQHGLELGDLKGNEFVITLRDCHLACNTETSSAIQDQREQLEAVMKECMTSLHAHGFINYYGLQRFGTFSTRTDMTGLNILRGDFKSACDLILQYNPEALAAAQSPQSPPSTTISSEDRSRALAIHTFATDPTSKQALEILPRRFSAETSLIRHLARHPTDYAGALRTVSHHLRTMYMHAYQSFVWNHAASERWRLFGDRVVEGDLVIVDSDAEEHNASRRADVEREIDADGDPVLTASGSDRATTQDEAFERARPLSAAEAASGIYSVSNVVLPLPGYDVVYPSNVLGDWYTTFMASNAGGGLDPHDMRRKERAESLSGGYRKLVGQIMEGWSVEVKIYNDGAGEEKQFVRTDLELLHRRETKAGDEKAEDGAEGDKLAVVLKFQLPASQYATIALRELSHGDVIQYKPDFSRGR